MALFFPKRTVVKWSFVDFMDVVVVLMISYKSYYVKGKLEKVLAFTPLLEHQ